MQKSGARNFTPMTEPVTRARVLLIGSGTCGCEENVSFRRPESDSGCLGPTFPGDCVVGRN